MQWDERDREKEREWKIKKEIEILVKCFQRWIAQYPRDVVNDIFWSPPKKMKKKQIYLAAISDNMLINILVLRCAGIICVAIDKIEREPQ